jgi:hypothetical protein
MKNIGNTTDRRSFIKTTLLGGTAVMATGSESIGEPEPSLSSSISNPIAAIDTHTHVVHGNPDLKPIPEEMERLTQSAPDVKARRLRSDMEQANVQLAFAMGHVNGPNDDPLGINTSLQVAALVPGLRVIGIIDPRRTDCSHLQAIERQIERDRHKLVAFKAYLGYVHFGPEDPQYKPYYELAAKHSLPVIFHTGDTWSTKAKVKFAHPLRVDEVATDHPDVRFVMAHFGNPWLIDAAEVIFKNDNVWADLSGLYVGDEKSINELLKHDPLPDVASGVMIGELKRAFHYAKRWDRILYGSDWPLAPMSVYRRFVEAIIPKEHHEQVFRANAQQLFRVQL